MPVLPGVRLLGSDVERCGVLWCAVQAVNVASTVVAILLVDRLGRRFLFIEGGIQMILCEVRLKWDGSCWACT